MEHLLADTINFLLSIGEQTVTAISYNVPGSQFPYNGSSHTDIDYRTEGLTRRITVHKSEIPSVRDTSSQAMPNKIIVFIIQLFCTNAVFSTFSNTRETFLETSHRPSANFERVGIKFNSVLTDFPA